MKHLNVIVLILTFGISLKGQEISKYIVTDQFGYLPQSGKYAIIRDPQTGFDADESFTPGSTYSLVNALTGLKVFSASPKIWSGGNTDASSGDKAWTFDFSSFEGLGRYYVLDEQNKVRSYEFEISPLVYKDVLKHAVRMFFYQRAGFPKEAKYAGSAWADGASHLGPLQDKNCRLFSDKNNAATEVDVHGGWYDAGDFNKYTNWTAGYIVEMMKAYLENPYAWGDDYNIPESGNGIPDLLDEAKWGIDFLLRMQQSDGGVLCIVGVSHASPPSAATGQSLYGPRTTAASLNTSAAFALASKVYRQQGMNDYADTLLARAQKAWDWAVANPSVVFNNNSSSNGSQGVGAGNQEEDDFGRLMDKLRAACYLYEMTGNTTYRDFFNANYMQAHMFAYNNFVYPFETSTQEFLLYYSNLPGATKSVADQIKASYRTGMVNGSDNFPAFNSVKDPYRAHLASYTWGSNGIKSAQGSSYTDLYLYKADTTLIPSAKEAALGYLHYIHGVNPLSMLYLSNMYAFGGDHGVNEFYHSWFCDGSALWDRVGKSKYGPAPGFLTGGANPSYDWDGCCPGSCGSSGNNAICLSESISPPKGQPKQKAYKDFNTSWPLNSWSVTENSCGYQVNYIRLLSKFVDIRMDCNGVVNGSAALDACGTCTGGDTGLDPIINPCDCAVQKAVNNVTMHVCGTELQSPSGKYLWTSPGLYLDTLQSSLGCDSVLAIQLSLGLPSHDEIRINSCGSLVSPSGKYTWTATGIYTDTLTNANGCDSILTVDLEVLKVGKSTIYPVACNHYLSPSGKYNWTVSGIYYDTLVAQSGCDSLITIKLTIKKVSTTVTITAGTLTSDAIGASYRWLDCASGFTPVANETSRSFVPEVSGNYAVELSQYGCADTSACYELIVSGAPMISASSGFKLVPNPTNGPVFLFVPANNEPTLVELTDYLGRNLKTIQLQASPSTQIKVSDENLIPGIYFIRISAGNHSPFTLKLVKN